MHSWAVHALVGVTFCVGCGSPNSLVKSDPQANQKSPTTDAANSDTAPVVKAATTKAAEEAQVIGFDDLNLGMPEDARFRPFMLEFNDGRAKELMGTAINIAGHMNPPDQLRGLKEFVLLKNKDCKFGPGGQADHLARIKMKEGTTVDYTDDVIYVEGVITLNPFPLDMPMTWSIYDIEATNVSNRPPRRSQ